MNLSLQKQIFAGLALGTALGALSQVMANPSLRDALVAMAAGGLVTTLVLFIGASGTTSRLSAYFADAAPRLAHGYNVVNVILVDFRGFDTMGEITVLVTVAIGVRALLLIGRERGH